MTDAATVDTSPATVLQSAQQMDADTDPAPVVPSHTHRWLVASNDSPLAYNITTKWGEPQRWLPARCSTCGETKDFPADNYADTTWMWNEKNMRER